MRAYIIGAVRGLIGAIPGGSEGAANGRGVRRCASAGPVYVQGRNDSHMPIGTEFTIRASGPNRL